MMTTDTDPIEVEVQVPGLAEIIEAERMATIRTAVESVSADLERIKAYLPPPEPTTIHLAEFLILGPNEQMSEPKHWSRRAYELGGFFKRDKSEGYNQARV